MLTLTLALAHTPAYNPHTAACANPLCPCAPGQGVLYTDRMKPGALAKVRERVVALEEAFVSAHPGVAVRRLQAPVAKGFGGGAKRR